MDFGIASESFVVQCQSAAFARLMAEKYWCLTVLRMSMFSRVGFLLAVLSAFANIFLRDPRRGDHHGFDLGEGLDQGTLACSEAFSLLRWVWKQDSRRGGLGLAEVGAILKPARASLTSFSESSRHLGTRRGSPQAGESKRIRMGTWSDPVGGRELASHVDECLLRRGEARARSSTEERACPP